MTIVQILIKIQQSGGAGWTNAVYLHTLMDHVTEFTLQSDQRCGIRGKLVAGRPGFTDFLIMKLLAHQF